MDNGRDINDRLCDIGGVEFDPIGVSMLLSIFSAAVKTLGGVIEYGPTSAENQEARRQFHLIRNEILSLQNSLDDFVLLVDRFVHESDNVQFGDQKLTVSDTMMVLRERNYQRWRSIQDTIQSIDHRIYDLLREIRSLNIEYMIETQREEPFDAELIHQFDSIILQMGEMTFVTLIKRLRNLLDSLARSLARLAHMEKM